MSNKNSILLFLASQENIVQQNDLFQLNKKITKNLLALTSKFDSMVNQNEELTSQVQIVQNKSRVLQNAFKIPNKKLIELERRHYKLEQYSRKAFFSGIPNTIPQADLENFVLSILKDITINLESSQIEPCHRLRKSKRTIVKFLNRMQNLCLQIRGN